MKNIFATRKIWLAAALALAFVACAYLLSVAYSGDPNYLVHMLTLKDSSRVTWGDLADLLGDELDELPLNQGTTLPELTVDQYQVADQHGEIFRVIHITYAVEIGGHRAYSFVYNSSDECVLSSPDQIGGDLRLWISDITGDGHLEKMVSYPEEDNSGMASNHEVLKVYRLERSGAAILLEVRFNILPAFDHFHSFAASISSTDNGEPTITLLRVDSNNDVTFMWDSGLGHFTFVGKATKDWSLIFPTHTGKDTGS